MFNCVKWLAKNSLISSLLSIEFMVLKLSVFIEAWSDTDASNIISSLISIEFMFQFNTSNN